MSGEILRHIRDLHDNDPNVRLKAVAFIPAIAQALGVDRTKDELIPYLSDVVDKNDNVVVATAKELCNLLNYSGFEEAQSSICNALCAFLISGSNPEYIQNIVECIRESVVKVPAMMQAVYQDWISDLFRTEFLNYINAGSCMVEVLMPHMQSSEFEKQVLEFLLALSSRDIIAIRSRVAKTLYVFAKYCNIDLVKKELLKPATGLCTDLSAGVATFGTLFGIACCERVSELLKNGDNGDDDDENDNDWEESLKLLFGCIMDTGISMERPWRVRHVVASKALQILKFSYNFKENGLSNFFGFYTAIIQDCQPEVRHVAFDISPNLIEYAASRSMDDASELVKILVERFTCIDSEQDTNIRCNISHIISELICNEGSRVKELFKDDIKDKTRNCLLRLIGASDFDNSTGDARRAALLHLRDISQFFGLNGSDKELRDILKSSVKDSVWQVRYDVLGTICYLSKEMDEVTIQEYAIPSILEGLSDSFDVVRKNAVVKLIKLSSRFDSEWTQNNVINRLYDEFNTGNCWIKTSILKGLVSTPKYFNNDFSKDIICTFCSEGMKSTIPSIILSFETMFLELFSKHSFLLTGPMVVEICDRLKIWEEDNDNDIKTLAKKCLEIYKQ